MSHENVEEIYERLTKAFFVDRDVEAFVECFHPEVEVLLPRNVLEGGATRGHPGVRQAFGDAFEMWEDLRFELHELASSMTAPWLCVRASTSARAMPLRIGRNWPTRRRGSPRCHGSGGCLERKPRISGAFLRAADGIRTHDLLHGKQTL
jgi:hypothetical protein